MSELHQFSDGEREWHCLYREWGTCKVYQKVYENDEPSWKMQWDCDSGRKCCLIKADGRESENHKAPVLYRNEFPIPQPEPPRPDFKQGQIIEVADRYGDVWCLRRFVKWECRSACCLPDGEDDGGRIFWQRWRLPQ